MTSRARQTASALAPLVGRSLDEGRILIVVLAAGLLLRAAIAGLIVPGSGFRVDVGNFAGWAYELAAVGPGGFYKPGYWADYPPGYLYVLWLIGWISRLWTDATGGVGLVEGLVKVPAILGDVAGAGMLFVFVRHYFARPAALVAAAAYLLNPGVIFDSAVWGQIDGVGTFVILAALYALARGWTEAASALAVLATLVKFQFAFVIPIVLIVGLKRHVWGRSSDPALDGTRDNLRVLTSLSAALVTLVVLIWPFGLTLYSESDQARSLYHKFVEIAGTYPGLSVNAFNLWMNPISNLAAGGGQWGDDRLPVLAIGSFVVTWQLVGTLLFFAVAALALWILRKRDDGPALLFVALLVAVAFFVVPTRVHERYLFPALAFAAPFIVSSWRWRVLYGVLSASVFLNIYYAYTIDYFENPGVERDPIIAATFLSPPGIYLLSFAAVLALVWLIGLALHAMRLPWGIVPHAAVEEAEDETHARAGATPSQAEPAPPPGTESAGAAAPLPRVLRWLRPEPAAARDGPGPGLGARDVLLCVAIALIALGFRVWRLDTPVAMHFDEVYHARSATEWLANWRFGQDRDVYEWTHPMMAKYLIAGGLVLVDPNKVVNASELDEPASLLAVAPERALSGRDRSLLFVADGDAELVVRDAETYAELATWTLDEPVGALVWDDQLDRLLVGSSQGGMLHSYPVTWDDASPPSTGPPTEVSLDSGLGDVLEIDPMARPGQQVAVRGSDGIAVLDLGSRTVVAGLDLSVGGVGYMDNVGENRPAIVVTSMSEQALRYLDAATLADVTVTRVEDQPCPTGYHDDTDPATLVCIRGSVPLERGPVGPLTVQGSGSDQSAWIPLTPSADQRGAFAVVRAAGTAPDAVVPLPDTPRNIVWNPVTNIVYVSGPDRVWVIEPHGESRSGGERTPDFSGYAVFDEVELGHEPLAMALDANRHSPGEDHERLIVATSGEGGAANLVSIDVGDNAFAWRLAGIVFGAILAALVYLMAATLFNRRRVAVLAGLFVAFDAMSFAQSRISMNDIFVAVFIVAAYLLFWQIWSGRWARSAWWVLPLVGALIGLAAGTKWVGFYALAGLWILVLARSDLGRLVLLAGGAFLFVVAGIGAPWPFAAVLVLMVAVLAAIAWARPVKIGSAQLRALPSSGLVLGAIGFAFALSAGELTREDPVGIVSQLLTRGAEAVWPAVVMIAITVALLVWRAVLSRRDPASDRRWFLPEEMGGFSWTWVGASLIVVPMVVYTLTWIPYLQLGHTFATPGLGPGYGWSLEEMHVQMFSYHFGLQSGHPASSPWWSWPMVLRPVWFYQGNFDGSSIAVIYNGGNLILFWLGVPAIAYCAYQAWRRQSLALLLITVAFALQWMPWTRIERATFLYHYFTALPFFMLALAYLADDALRRRSTAGIATAFGVAAIVLGVLLYPISGALPMPDWYIHAFQALPPWNFGAQFPDPPQGERTLISQGGLLRLVVATGVAALAAGFAIYGRDLLRRLSSPRPPAGPSEPVPESG